ncbi:DUF885 domain-containing protein [Burkholderiaceae bacterium DAT-1]|nr:DUF885 domain-containing protein [Burkholderiaceae bacterium DAT-1]
MKYTLIAAALATACLSFAPVASATTVKANAAHTQSSEDARFDQLVKQFLDDYWKHNPDSAVSAGYYKYADVLDIPNAASRKELLRFVNDWQKRFAALNTNRLDDGHRTDLAMLNNQLDAARWYQETFRSWEWSPANYGVAEPLSLMLANTYAPLETRLQAISKRLARVPAYYEAAKANIHQPVMEHTQLAIDQNPGNLEVLDSLEKKLGESKLSAADKALFTSRVAAARKAIQGYGDWLKDLKASLEKNGNARSFRIGKALYEPMFAYEIQAGMTAEQLYHRALQEKESLLGRMDKLSVELWPKYMGDTAMPADRFDRIGQLINKMSEHHVKVEEFVPEIKRRIPILEAWVDEHHLVSQDKTRPLVVRETPVYMRGTAGASISAPGPYDPKANTYYNVTPLDGDTPERAESWLREYNDWILQILSIHEAVPGHYVQLMHANKSPSIVKTIFGNGAMVEGWAVYSERMMLESGYGGNTPEMWFMYAKWNLRVVSNTILDYSIHVLDMSKEDALKMLTREAFQSQAEAEGKWRRASLSQVQLTSYFAGFAEIYDFRNQLKAEQGEKFNLYNFHEQFLSYGSAPVRLIKEMMRKH